MINSVHSTCMFLSRGAGIGSEFGNLALHQRRQQRRSFPSHCLYTPLEFHQINSNFSFHLIPMARTKQRARMSSGPGVPRPLNRAHPRYPQFAKEKADQYAEFLARVENELAALQPDTVQHQAKLKQVTAARRFYQCAQAESDNANLPVDERSRRDFYRGLTNLDLAHLRGTQLDQPAPAAAAAAAASESTEDDEESQDDEEEDAWPSDSDSEHQHHVIDVQQ